MGVGFNPAVFQGPDLEPLAVLDLLDRPLGVGQIAEAVFPEGQRLDIGLAEVIEQFLTDRSIQNQVNMIEISEKKGEIQDVDRGAEPAERAGGCHQQVDGALLDPLGHFAFTLAQLVAGIEFYRDAPVGPLLHQIGKLLRTDHVGVIHALGGCQFPGGLVLRRPRRPYPCKCKRHQNCENKHENSLHFPSSFD
jgi:hypothetical protein